jgi:hypothetical protein
MKITKTQLKQIIKEELEEALNIQDLMNKEGEWRKMDDASARQRYNDYVLSQGEYENGGLLDPDNRVFYNDFIEWMRLHPEEFRNELSSLERGEEPMVAYAAKMSARRRK